MEKEMVKDPAINFKRGLYNIFTTVAVAFIAVLFLLQIGNALAKSAPDAATVTVAHFAPFANTIDGTSVTVRINGTDTLTDFKFNTIITGVVLPAGTYLIEVLPTGTSTVAISATVTISDGVDYTVAAIGNGTDQPLELYPLIDDNRPSATGTNAKVRIAHLAPFADTLSGTQVNICTDAGLPVVSNVPYKVHTDPYAELPAGDYDLKIVPAADGCGTPALDLPPITLAGGGVYDIFAIGDITNQPLRIASITGLSIAADPTGIDPVAEPMDTQLFLPMMSVR